MKRARVKQSEEIKETASNANAWTMNEEEKKSQSEQLKRHLIIGNIGS